MTMQRAKLADIQYLPAAVGSLYANPAGTKTFIRAITLFNSNAGVETVKLYNVPDNAAAVGVAGGGNQFLEQNLQSKETLIIELPYPIVLTDQNDSMQGVTTTASKVTVMLHGDKE